MTNITISRDHVRDVAPDLYGLFFEDINRSSDSGLYPEMIRNRSFEDGIEPADTTVVEDGVYFRTREGHMEPFAHGEGDPKWAEELKYTKIPGWYSENAEMELDRCDVLNEKREASLHVKFNAGGSIYNIGYCGMSAQKDYPVVFYAFLKASEDGELTISMVGKDGTVLVSEKAPVKAGPFVKTDVRLVPTGTDDEARLVISSDKAMDVKIGFSSLMPERTYMGHGLREDLVNLLKMTNSKFMRYPGGCIVEGINWATALRFSELVGPVWERPSIWNLWHYRASYGFGFHEFLQLCEDLNMEALYVMNCGMSCQVRHPEFYEGEKLETMINETLWAIEYATGDVSTKWGALRAEMGHPEPFTLKYIEIGNENDGPEYDARYRIIYDILQKSHPEITLISNAHTENRGLPTDYVDEHYYFDWQFFAQSGHMYDRYPEDGPKVFLGEVAITRGEDIANLHAALSEAQFMMGCENRPEVVKLAAYAPLFENVKYTQWYPNLIFFDNHRSAGIPSLHTLGMLGESRGKKILSINNDSEKITPIKYGFSGFIAYENGLRMKMPYVNGEKAHVCKEVLGQWIEDGDVLVSDNTLMPGKSIDSPTRYPIQKSLCNTIFNSEKATCTEFTTNVYVDEKTPKFALTCWVHNVTEPGIMNMYPDPNAPEGTKQPNEIFHLGDIEYYTWTIEGTKGVCNYLYRYNEFPLDDAQELPIRMGEYNEFKLVTGEGYYDCYLNGEKVAHAEDRFIRRVDSIVTEDDTYVYVKLLNNTDQGDSVKIDLGEIACEASYEWKELSGDPKATNTLDDPNCISAISGTAEIGAEGLTWNSKAWSLAVLKLKKK